MASFSEGRHAGLLVPLFSMASSASWGIGEICDLPVLANWVHQCGLDIVQLLPVNEMATGQNSPYSALSAMALDPIYIALSRLPDFQALGGVASLSPDARERLRCVQQSASIHYEEVRRLKGQALRAAFARFRQSEWPSGTNRARDFQAFQQQQWWLPEYALFRALHERYQGRAWTEWPDGLRSRDEGALQQARAELSAEILFYEYLQWVASTQWKAARRELAHVGLFGDFPFVVGTDSADVWVRQDQFHIDASVGVPPDAFSETGQDWGLPVYRWDVHAEEDFAWLRERALRSAELYDGYRVDHLVGFYRTYVIPQEGEPFFLPEDEADQLAQGERLMRIFCGSGPRIIAEDLGTVPDFVRASLARLGVPGYRVLRWDREWELPHKPFRDPATYPPVSVATTGTHDTEPMRLWWESAREDERRQVLRLPAVASAGVSPDAPYSDALRDAFLRALFNAGSDFLILPIQDVFGWSDRINVPATVGMENWTYRLPWPVDRLDDIPEACAVRDRVRAWAEESGRATRR